METSSKASEEVEKEKLEIVKAFSDKVLEKYRDIVKCIALFGEHEVISDAGRDIDVFIVLDDTKKTLSEEELAKIQDDIDKIGEEISSKLSIQPPYSLTEFWSEVRVCSPIIYNIIKTGKPVYDTGFFSPVQRLLNLGKIPLSREQIFSLIEDASMRIARAKEAKLAFLIEFYDVMLNATQAVLMWLNVPPPPPSKAYNYAIEYLVKPGMMEREYAEWLKNIIEIRNKIKYKEISSVSGQFVDEWLEKAEKYVNKMYILHSALEHQTKRNIIKNTYEVTRKVFEHSLKLLNKLPENEDKIPEIFRNEIIEKKMVSSRYFDVWNELTNLKKLVDEENIEEIDLLPYEKVLHLREEVRRMISDIAKALRKKEEELGKIEEYPAPK